MNAPLDAIAVHALNTPDRVAVVVDGHGGATPSITTFGELNALVHDGDIDLLSVWLRLK